jgi:hypothetical protein
METTIEAESHEVLTPDVIDDDDHGQAMVPAVRESALEAAARAALDEPGIPGRDEFLSLAMQARVLSMSGLAPKSLQGKPADVFMILLAGRDLGISTTAALRKIYVVDGQPSLAPLLLNMRIRRLGIGRIVPAADNDIHKATAIALGPDDRPLGPASVFTWEDAQRAELVRSDCRADNHSEACQTAAKSSEWNKRKAACKDNYRHYPARMLWWRACGNAADDYFPEAALGTYSPDELGEVTDENGNPIDPETVALPEGYGPKAVAPPEPASDDDRAELRRRIDALPEEGQLAVKDAVLATRGREGVEPLGSLDKFPARQLVRWKAVVAAVESRAKKGEWGDWKAPADAETGEVPPAEEPGNATSPSAPAVTADDTTPAPSPQKPADEAESTDPADSEQPTLLGGMDDPAVLHAAGDEQVKVTVALVKAMSQAKVDAQLAELGLETNGAPDTRRHRLTVAYLRRTLVERGE